MIVHQKRGNTAPQVGALKSIFLKSGVWDHGLGHQIEE